MQNKKLLFLPHAGLQDLINILAHNGFTCIGPQARAGAIVYDKLTDAKQLPWGIIDHQKPGYYSLEKTALAQAFAWTNGPQAIKPYLFKSCDITWCAEKSENRNIVFHEQNTTVQPLAFIGARSCDLAGMAIQDKILMEDRYVDPFYKMRRQNFFIIAVNCCRSSGNCFCVSTGDGPKATKFFDIAMSEVDTGFVVEIGTQEGERIAMQLNLLSAEQEQINQVATNINNVIKQQTKKLPPVNLRDLLFSNLDHPRWDNVAKRCLSCTNCTQVCPTCFCQCATENPNLLGTQSIHSKVWDSCFTDGHSYIHGNLIREDTRKRYRQWLTHKLGSWHDQFGMSGCVGCGRCITWCPVGIDITVETNAIYEEPRMILQEKEGSVFC